MNAPNAKIIVSNADITITLFSTKVMEIVINARNGGRQLFSDNVSSEIQKSLFQIWNDSLGKILYTFNEKSNILIKNTLIDIETVNIY